MQAAALQAHLQALYERSELTDAQVNVIGEDTKVLGSFRVHRAVLSLSGYFKAIMSDDWAGRAGGMLPQPSRGTQLATIEIDTRENSDITPEAVDTLIRYLYGQEPAISSTAVRSLLFTASYLDVPSLMVKLSDWVFSSLADHNVVDFLCMVHEREFGDPGKLIEDASIATILRNAVDIGGEDLSRLPLSKQRRILLSQDLFTFTEFQRYKLALQMKRHTLARLREAMAGAEGEEASAAACPEVDSKELVPVKLVLAHGDHREGAPVFSLASFVARAESKPPAGAASGIVPPPSSPVHRAKEAEAAGSSLEGGAACSGGPLYWSTSMSESLGSSTPASSAVSRASVHSARCSSDASSRASQATSDPSAVSTARTSFTTSTAASGLGASHGAGGDAASQAAFAQAVASKLLPAGAIPSAAPAAAAASSSSGPIIVSSAGGAGGGGRVMAAAPEMAMAAPLGSCASAEVLGERTLPRAQLVAGDRDWAAEVQEVEEAYAEVFAAIRYLHFTPEQLQEALEDAEVDAEQLLAARRGRTDMLHKLEVANTYNVRKLTELHALAEDGISAALTRSADAGGAPSDGTAAPGAGGASSTTTAAALTATATMQVGDGSEPLGHPDAAAVKDIKWPGFRFGVEVPGVFAASMEPTPDEEPKSLSSERVYFAGSLWCLDLKRYLQRGEDGSIGGEFIAVYLRRRSMSNTTFAAQGLFEDRRDRTTMAFSIRLCGSPGAPTSNSVCGKSVCGKAFGVSSESSWGWESYISQTNLTDRATWSLGDKLRFVVNLDML